MLIFIFCFRRFSVPFSLRLNYSPLMFSEFFENVSLLLKSALQPKKYFY